MGDKGQSQRGVFRMKSWNSETNRLWYEKTMEEAFEHGLTGYELKLSHQNLSNPSLITKSKRIYRMVLLAFFLGRLRQIRWMDEGLDMVSPADVKR